MSHLNVARKDGIAVCTITPPDGFMTAETTSELVAAAAELAADAAVRAVVFTGGLPDVFIRHYDVRELEALARRLQAKEARFSADRPVPERPIDSLFQHIAEMPKPVIAAINGTAMGGGFELCLACDIRIAAAGNYRLGLPEINIGILPGAGGTQRLARIVGQARALEMMLQGRTIIPDEAWRFGLVQEVVEGPLLARATSIARSIAAKSPAAVAHIKRLVRREAAGPLDQGLAVERTLFLDLLASEAAIDLMHRMNNGLNDIENV